MQENTDDILHYGVKRRSGRYPWGSGEDPHDFSAHVKSLEKNGMSQKEIAQGLGISIQELRASKSIARNEIRQGRISQAQALKDKGHSTMAIARRMEIPESTVRQLLKPGETDKVDIIKSTSDVLRRRVDEVGYLDVGKGVHHHLGVSMDRLGTAIEVLKTEGYQVHRVKSMQLGTGLNTEYRVLTTPGKTQRDVFMNRDKIRLMRDYSEDGGRTFMGIHPPRSISPNRVGVRYADEGGADADGVMYVRPGVKDVSLGGSSYAQVRVAVGKGHFLKGMAMYKDDLPEGVDILFNTNKHPTGNHLDAMKPMKDDPDNPFGSYIKRQITEPYGKNPDGSPKHRVTSVMNIVNDEGDWGRWSNTIASQVLGKQPIKLVREQLDKTYKDRSDQLREIEALTNPVVKRRLLRDYADTMDSAAVHLKAKALPRQATHIILPIPSLKDTEVYAPNFEHGERVALVRYPHAGTFEIPQLVVNNRHAESKKTLGPHPKDAIGINPRVAERLSGADFDGDFVLVIPNNSGKVHSSPALKGLADFDPISRYKQPPGTQPMTKEQKAMQMGMVSNLITDMTVRKASPSELARAVRHSMVVIDAEKHNLDWRRSAEDNGVRALIDKYQVPYQESTRARGGASTLLSRASSEKRIPERRLRKASEGGPVDPDTGEVVWVNTGAETVNKRGSVVPKTTTTTKLADTKDAHTLSTGTPVERLYADYSNNIKALANRARKSAVDTPGMKYSPSAKVAYKKEYDSLSSKLRVAQINAPLERQAQLVANSIYAMKKRSTPDMDLPTSKKVKGMALEEARRRVGAKKSMIEITDREWEAIQAGAITTFKLEGILASTDMDAIKARATPRTPRTMSPTNQARARAMFKQGATRADIAKALGISLSTLDEGVSL
jgi:DNA-binding CsgD family transcriptional regulator